MEFAQNIWQTLVRAKADKKHPWRVLTLATQSHEGPELRQVVLRGVNVGERCITVYTDARSQKIKHISTHPSVGLLFWDARHNWQLRLWAHAQAESDSVKRAALWASIPDHARKDYATHSAPGDALGPSGTPAIDLVTAEQHFVVLHLQVHRMDSLVLKREGHQRMALNWQQDHWQETALVP
ncbi:MAG TPA: pyridoxamine 5'-phosphate oxidase family protein [Limnobacter sp.]|nr:pyridoxamine 5'-phosphate oxidase family protein [Limnobacter sp.]